ncbi:Na+/H+ antiporter subunit E [Actinomyces mediterranea]|uniref:Na+/H+ antiporter subunit E n=1 Tax=Actinomyces mediterranea TaxID=1871028 RepID=UPI0009FB119F|nr:Na+/H+ antiporter subunit E [Actinomyces mediterranea]
MMGTPPRVMKTRRQGRISASLTLWLVVVWLMLFHELTPLTVVSGILTAVGIQLLLPMERVGTRWRARPIALLRLLSRFLVDLVKSGLQVSWIVLSGACVARGIVRVDLRSDDPVHLTILSAMTSLIPGSIVVRVDQACARIYLHILDLDAQGGPEGVRRAIREQEARILRAIAPSDVVSRLEDCETTGQGEE